MAGAFDIKDLQRWINPLLVGKGIPLLKEDGAFGPLSQRAFIEAFRNKNAKAITIQEEHALAERLGVFGRSIDNLARLRAVAEIEAPSGGWDKAGLLACLYERHYLYKRIKIKVPLLSDPAPGGYTVDIDKDGVNDSWQKVAKAIAVSGPQYAIECASYGKFQVMGAWWDKLGYPSPWAMLLLLSESEAAHYEICARYIEKFGLLSAYQNIGNTAASAAAFAKGYNGSAYAQHNYHGRISQAFVKHRARLQGFAL